RRLNLARENRQYIGNISVRIGLDSPIKLVILYHLHVGTLDTKIDENRALDNSRTRRSFEFLHQSFDLGCFDKKFLDERLFDMRTLSAGRQSSSAGRQSGRRGESRAAERIKATFKPPIDYTPLNNLKNHIKASSSALEQSSRIGERFLVFWVRYGGGNSDLNEGVGFSM
ncbi:hypothetical protein Tco_1061456, partial [Tanacetum coccineum]